MKSIPYELRPRQLVAAYASGAFPMPDPEDAGRLLWFSPDPRCLLPLDERFHVSRRLAATIRQGRFVCTIDRDFSGVMRGCAVRPEGTWITDDFLAAYGELHRLGVAHSVEAYLPAKTAPLGRAAETAEPCELAGGVYGLAIGGAFFAESMFHRATDAGKVALVFLIDHLRQQGFQLCDVQWITPNLARFGAYEISRSNYLHLLVRAVGRSCQCKKETDFTAEDAEREES